MSSKIITRFPPSPTGPLHIGNVRSALFNYLFAKNKGGQFIVRVEDTDKERSLKEYELDMLESLKWLGLEREGELWHQSERTEVYKTYLKKLIAEDKAYISQESEGKNREVVRFRNPNKSVSFDDLIRGKVEFDTTELGDFIIARNIEEPVYHLAVVVDDFETGVTHIIRGEDHVSNTPRQILIQEAIGANRPTYAHLPLLLAADRSKLSKRKHGESVSLKYYRDRGYLPEAMINYLALLGWNPGTEQEIFTLEQLIEAFDIAKVQKGGAVLDEKKLRWVNKEHLKRLSQEEIFRVIRGKLEQAFPGEEIPNELMTVIFERIEIWSDIDVMVREGELDYFFSEPELVREKISWKTDTTETTATHLEETAQIIKQTEGLDQCEVKIMANAEASGKGSVLWPLRYALSGKEKSPDPITLLRALGKDEALKRIDKAVKILNES
jgi:glutamyl-tRNA synthetase